MKNLSVLRMVASLAVVATLALPAQAIEASVPTGHGSYSFRCSDNEQLRIIFNASERRAVVARIRRPPVTLQQVDSSGGYRFTRGNDYELSGNTEQISWRVGSAQPLVCHRGER